MALSKEAKISTIVLAASSISKKDKSVIGSRLKDFTDDELKDFEKSLKKLESAPEAKRTPVKKVATESKRNHILDTILRKLEENEDRGVKLRLNAISEGLDLVGEKLQNFEKDKLIERFKRLTSAINNLSIAKCIMQFEQGRLIHYLIMNHKMSGEDLATTFDITQRKVADFHNFYRLCLEYPGLVFSSYTMGTIVSYQKDILAKAKTDQRFDELLKMQQEYISLVPAEGGGEQEKILRNWFEDEANFIGNANAKEDEVAVFFDVEEDEV